MANLKLPWVLLTDQLPECAKCEKDGVRGERVVNAEGETVFFAGHEIYYMPEFELASIVAAVNERGHKEP